MPKLKMKTHKGASKRLWVTGGGKIKRQHANATHKFVTKSAKRKRRLRGSTILRETDLKRAKRLLPYA